MSSEWRFDWDGMFLTGEAGSDAGNCDDKEKLGDTPDREGVPAEVGRVDELFSLLAAESSESEPRRNATSRSEKLENRLVAKWVGVGGWSEIC